MARTILLNPSEVYRAVILMRVTGLTNLQMEQYEMPDGTVIDYHLSRSYGPYDTTGPARAQLKRETRFIHSHGLWDHTTRLSLAPGVLEVESFLESSTPVWTKLS